MCGPLPAAPVAARTRSCQEWAMSARPRQDPRMTETFAAFTAEKTDDGFRRGVTELDRRRPARRRRGRRRRVVERQLQGRIWPRRRRGGWPGSRRSCRASTSPARAREQRRRRGSRATRSSPTATTSASRTTEGTPRSPASPAEWIVPLPDGLTTREAMLVGTAGYTAALSVLALLDHGIVAGGGHRARHRRDRRRRQHGGGDARRSRVHGRRRHAASPTPSASSARSAPERSSPATSSPTLSKPLQPPAWSGAVDVVGGATLAHVLAGLAPVRRGRRQRQRRRRRAADHGVAVHPARASRCTASTPRTPRSSAAVRCGGASPPTSSRPGSSGWSTSSTSPSSRARSTRSVAAA